MIAGLSAGISSLVLNGCSSTPRGSYTRRPTPWQGYPAEPTGNRNYQTVRPTANNPSQPNYPTQQPAPTAPRTSTPNVAAIDRSTWTRQSPVVSKVNPMKGVSKITIHHEGWDPVWFSDSRTTAARIEKIRRYHVEDKRWGDIGYHYIIDRAGRVWEGRPLKYQGAHVSKNNEHNIGILVLGNFEKQAPSTVQLRSLYVTTANLSRGHGVKPAMVRSHKEINPTTCPGRNLQRQMNALRQQLG